MKRSLVLIAGAWLIAAAHAAPPPAPVVIQAAGKPVLTLQLPAGGTAREAAGKTVVVVPSRELYFELRTVEAKSVADALPGIPALIVSDVKAFKPATTNELTVAGAPAKHLLGPGIEADDDDPGKAEVVVFIVGGRMFAACVHGEADHAAKQRAALLDVLQTAKAP